MTGPQEHPESRLRVGAILVAAGEGRRMGSGENKILRDLGGQSILERSVKAMAADPRVRELIVVVRSGEEQAVRSRLDPLDTGCFCLRLTPGGEQRSDSVRQGVAAASNELDILLVHDAARPFVSKRLLSSVIEQAAACGAAIPTIPVNDTLKRVRDDQVLETIDRTDLFGAQTPQAFRARLLRSALRQADQDDLTHTDEAQLLELLGVPVWVVPGDPQNIKITSPEDLELAASLLNRFNPEQTPPGDLA